MFEITYNDKDKLQSFVDCGKAYKNAIYDFTFENRFIVYHFDLLDCIEYIALDKMTGYGSEIIRKRPGKYINPIQYRDIVPNILNSIKYTGHSRYLQTMADRPLEVIDSIFRVILPEYGYSVREEQITLSKKIYKGLTEKLVSVCEAEVGTGKTLAYLIASYMANNRNRKIYGNWFPITISTSSIELQKALVEKEIPHLSRMLQDFGVIEHPLTSVLRKGKEHYFCRYRYEDLMRKLEQYPKKYSAMIESFENTDFANKVFDLDKINLRPSIKSKICVMGSCRGCKYKDDCKYSLFLTAAHLSDEIDFQVTNHNLYLASMKMRAEDTGKILKSSNLIVVDEAHKLKDAAQDIFGARIGEKEVSTYLNIIKHHGRVSVTSSDYRKYINKANSINRILFARLIKKSGVEDSEGESGNIINLSNTDKTILIELIEIIDLLENSRKKISGELNGKGSLLLNKLKSFIQSNNINIWLETDENGVFSLCNSAKNIGEVLYDNIWNKDVSHVLTSGTMSDGTSFTFFEKENGLDHINHRLIQHTSTPSPFDYDRNARLYIPKGMPAPDNDSDEYIKAIAEKVLEIIEATNGHTAILFTSYKVLSSVYELTQEKLKKYNVFKMTRKNNTVIGDFKKSKNGILFASGSMWEGVDCVGDCLSSVIIVRLPFPMRSATLEQKKDTCSDVSEFVKTYAVPEMLIKLRQGVGRLIRSETDTGLVTILDSRALDGAYASRVHRVMKKYPRVYSTDEIKKYFKAVKSAQYFED